MVASASRRHPKPAAGDDGAGGGGEGSGEGPSDLEGNWKVNWSSVAEAWESYCAHCMKGKVSAEILHLQQPSFYAAATTFLNFMAHEIITHGQVPAVEKALEFIAEINETMMKRVADECGGTVEELKGLLKEGVPLAHARGGKLPN